MDKQDTLKTIKEHYVPQCYCKNMIWIVGVNQTETPFYTSDTAAIRKGYEGVSGFASRGLEITFPITPKLKKIYYAFRKTNTQ